MHCQIDGHQLTLKSVSTRVVETLIPAHKRTTKQHIANLECLLCGALHTFFINSAMANYYICSKDTKRAVSECPVKQISSGDIEELVRQQLQKMLSDITLIMRFAEKSGMNPVDVADCFREEFWNEISPGEYNRLVILLVEKATVWQDWLELELKTSGVKSLMEKLKNE